MNTKHSGSSPRTRAQRFAACALLLFALAAASGTSAAPSSTVLLQDLGRQADSATADAARQGLTPELVVVGVPLAGPAGLQDGSLRLRQIEVFAPDASIIVHSAGGEVTHAPPRHTYFAGTIDGQARSRAILSLLEDGGVRGVVTAGASWWRITDAKQAEGSSPLDDPVRVHRIDLSAGGGDFQCGNEQLPNDLDSLLPARTLPASAVDQVATKGIGPQFTARIAFETDQEYLSQFGGNVSAATDYVGDLVALGSAVYTDEVETSWLVSSVSLWAIPDPWVESPGSCALYEFGKYWNDNNGHIDRTIAHMLSGKNPNSGVAWVGVLCTDDFSPFPIVTSGCVGVPTNITGDEYGGAYGFTGGIDGDLDINSPAPIWDSVAVLHEIGHNFNSPHTHCYNGLGGSAEPIDRCFSGQSGCYAGPTSRPDGCPGGGNNCGTIMSYCHFLGGIENEISLTLGTSWLYGILPDRVPTRMSAHVATQHGLNPGCLDFVADDTVFNDGFESGDTTAWSSTVQ